MVITLCVKCVISDQPADSGLDLQHQDRTSALPFVFLVHLDPAQERKLGMFDLLWANVRKAKKENKEFAREKRRASRQGSVPHTTGFAWTPTCDRSDVTSATRAIGE